MHNERLLFRVCFSLSCTLTLLTGVAATAHLWRQSQQPQMLKGQQAFPVAAVSHPLARSVFIQGVPSPLLCMAPPPDFNRKRAVAVFATDPPRIVFDVGMGTRYDNFCWSANRQNLLVCTEDGNLVLLPFDAAKQRFGSPQSLARALGRRGANYTLTAYNSPFAWSHDGRFIVIVEGGASLTLYDVQTGKPHLLLDMHRHKVGISNVTFAPDGKRLVFSATGHDIRNRYSQETHNDLWLVNSDGSGLRKLGHGDCPNWSPDGNWLIAVISGGREVRRYNPQTGDSRVLRRARLEAISNAVYSPDGRSIVMFGPYSEQGTSADGVFLTDSEGKFLRGLAGRKQIGVLPGDLLLAW